MTQTHPSRETSEVILSVAAEHDVQLVLNGVLPEGHLLGGPVLHGDVTPLPSAPLSPSPMWRQVTLEVGAGLAADLVSASRCVLRNQEFVPVGELTDVGIAEVGTAHVGIAHDGPGDHIVRGTLNGSRNAPAGFVHALRADLVAAGGDSIVIGLARPPTREDADQLSRAFAHRAAHVLILIGDGSSSGDEIGPDALEDVAHALVTDWDLGSRASVRRVPVIWRDAGSNRLIIERIAKVIDAASCITLLPDADDPGAQTWRRARAALLDGYPVDPDAFSPAVARAVLRRERPTSERGLVVMFTGLSGSGKSTLAKDLAAGILLESDRTVTLLDGDLVRRLLSLGLGFDRESRELNIKRISFVAAEVARHGGTAICAPIAPYASGREAARKLVRPCGDFVLIHVATPLEECERRDIKGLYARARAGLIDGFTGISDPYEYPEDAELRVDTSILDRQEAVAVVMTYLRSKGWVPSAASQRHAS